MGNSGFSQFAAEVVARVVARDGAPGVALKEPVLAAVLAAARHADPRALERVLVDIKRARVSHEAIVDHYIPEVARRLGRAWEDDLLSFADVSIGTARLQSFVKDIGQSWVADGTGDAAGSTVLVLVPDGEQHSLGARVAASWLHRKGVSVCLRVAPSARDVAAILAQRRFDGVMISVASHEKLESCTGLVKTLRESIPKGPPIALGGAILGQGENIVSVSGVDIVTNDLSKAAEALGLICKRPQMTVIT
ncbi:cobalamin B12-binding domain-containing protein [Rhodobacter sp. ETT8]|uniref:Cobalamin B12-binding domain-containing protein n=1 Tax=Pseudotabrizicola algicola TaxID=2709381 RepID=A0A6B3RHG5_9RHOB|nr:cobalamin B12-binding domain-containing protein [Pseudotabrizicola algicola]